MRRFGLILGFIALCAACSPSAPPAEEQPEPADQGLALGWKQAQALIEETLRGSAAATRTPKLGHDLPCIDMANVVTIEEGQAVLNPEAAGLFQSVVNEDDGFYLEYGKPLEWEVVVDDLREVSPGVVEIAYTATVVDPPHVIFLWFEACASESGTEKIQSIEKGTRQFQLSDDGEWKPL